MKGKAEEQLSDLRTGETKAQHNFDMMAQSLTDALAVAKEKIASTKSAIEVATEESCKAKASLAETQKDKKADEAYVKSLSKECDDAKEEWAARQESAKGEMAAIAKAQSILTERVRVFFVQTHKKGAPDDTFDTGADAEQVEKDVRDKVVAKLRTMSRKFNSYALMEMVSAAAADPFEKIKGLIEQMIAKLLSEANEEATQKGFCDEETAKSNAAKEDKTMTIDKLTSRLDKAKSTQATLEQVVKESQEELAALDKGTAEATAIRKEEHM